MSSMVTGAKARFSLVLLAAILAVMTARAGDPITPATAPTPAAPKNGRPPPRDGDGRPSGSHRLADS